jgi:hypothetical protein
VETETNYVASLALRWAQQDPLQRWIAQAEDAPREVTVESLRPETIHDYLAEHDPFPVGSVVEVMDREGAGWVRAVVVERCGSDEWTVEYSHGEQGWCDHSELRAPRAS